jgi:hypothetical protein
MTKMTPTVDYLAINLDTTHHRNLKTTMFFNVFYAIPLGFTTWNLSENELYKK